MKKHDLPHMPFYVGDWMKCPEVRSCSLAERGLWFDMICLMWESTERGVLVNPAGTPYTPKEISRIVGEDENLVNQMLNQMGAKHIFSGRESDGAIYCRRMVKDEANRKIWAENGKKGGNPKIGLSKSGYPNDEPKSNPNHDSDNDNDIDTETYPVKEVIEYLNLKAGKSYRTSTEANKKHVRARFADGHNLQDFKRVVDVKVLEWKGKPEEKFLRPETLFGTKFEGYLNQPKIQANGKLAPVPSNRILDKDDLTIIKSKGEF